VCGHYVSVQSVCVVTTDAVHYANDKRDVAPSTPVKKRWSATPRAASVCKSQLGISLKLACLLRVQLIT
jgi:hypothetical protein